MILIVRSVSKWYPELFLVFTVLLYWIFSGTLINPIAIVLITALNAQLVIKNKTFGVVLASIFILLSIYMSFQLISDVIQLEQFLPEGLMMLVSGISLFIFSGYFGFALLQKNIIYRPERLSIEND
ncbi:hypothetical protein ULMS_22060 [Patiriisocius marinistellae]|uniref:Uncharacterized protein n=1 Tax=Patiriisocius marinistellae TaxID=2494560 RepID=A0A5J4FZ66_9FLAO|nr:hypothetical protein [Patiriisocius marinistellae]GEQ86698.1 hypothetical protein ULMS_22060 [Patiriisocius marinistellae]